MKKKKNKEIIETPQSMFQFYFGSYYINKFLEGKSIRLKTSKKIIKYERERKVIFVYEKKCKKIFKFNNEKKAIEFLKREFEVDFHKGNYKGEKK